MYYKTADNYTVGVWTDLAGFCEEEYRYVVTSIKFNDTEYKLDLKAEVELEITPIFMLVNDCRTEYLVEEGILTEAEAEFYAADQAAYREWTDSKDQDASVDQIADSILTFADFCTDNGIYPANDDEVLYRIEDGIIYRSSHGVWIEYGRLPEKSVDE